MSHEKCRNYWKYLKGKLSKDGIQLVSVTNHFKFEVPDGKQRAADALDAECVQTLAKHYPNNRANAFLDWTQQMPSGSHCLHCQNWPLTMQKLCGMR